MKSSSEGSIKGGATSGFEAMGGSIIGAFSVKGDVVLDKSGVKIPGASAEFAISGKLEKEEPLISAVPAFLTALAWLEGFSPATAQWIAKRASAKLELEPKIAFAATFDAGSSGIQWKTGEATPTMGFKVTTALKLYEGDDDDDSIEARTGVGGEASITFKVPQPYFKQVDLKFTVFGAVKFRSWLLEREKAWAWSSASVAALAPSSPAATDPGPGWQLAGRDYLTAADYARWTGGATSASGPLDQQLIQNSYPDAKPVLVPNGNGSQYLIWVHDKPGSSAKGGTELAFASGSASGWSKPATYPTLLTNDDRGDFNPTAVRLPNGKLLVVWERMDTSAPPAFEASPKDYLSHSQIAARAFSPSSPAPVGDPLQLSASGSFNHRPRVGALSDGALAVWTNNAGNLLLGTAAAPDTLMFRRYYQATDSWSAAAPVVSNVAGLLNLELATAGDRAAVVYSRDMDGDMATEGDRELFYALYANGAWGALVRLTTNTVDDMAPELVLTDTGAPRLLWKQGDELRFLAGDWSAVATALPFAQAVTAGSRSMVGGKDGSLALVWDEAGEGDTRIGYAFYDGPTGRWSDARAIQPPVGTHTAAGQSAMVVDMAPALVTGLGAGDNLVVPYVLADVTPVTKTVDGVTTGLAPKIAAHHLRLARVPIDANLHVEPADLRSGLSAASAGQPVTVTATVRNTGLRPIVAGRAELVAQPLSGSGETVLGTQPIANLAGGATADVTFSLARPALADKRYVVRLTSTQPAAEADTRDNSATLGTELSIETGPTLYSGGGAVFPIRIRQSGGIPFSGIVPATLRLDGETGPVVGGAEVTFPVTPTASLETQAWVAAKDIGTGRHRLVWQVNADKTIGEANAADNTATTQATIGADLTTRSDDIQWSRQPGMTAPISIWVQNTGVTTSTTTTLQVLDGISPAAGAAAAPQAARTLSTLSVPALAPFARVEVKGTLNLAGTPAETTGLKTLAVRIASGNPHGEIDVGDNVVVAGEALFGLPPVLGTPRRVFLPLTRR